MIICDCDTSSIVTKTTSKKILHEYRQWDLIVTYFLFLNASEDCVVFAYFGESIRASSSLFSEHICYLDSQVFSALTPVIFGGILLRREGEGAQLVNIHARGKKGCSYIAI